MKPFSWQTAGGLPFFAVVRCLISRFPWRIRNFAHRLNTHLWYSIIFGLPFFSLLFFFADFTVFPAIMQSTFDTSKQGFEISLGLTGVLSLWLGIMKVGEKGGVVNALARLLGPIFARLFPDVPKGHPVVGNIFMNLAANMLGLDNAATPLGLKAMEGLQELNAKKDTASNPMIMFLVLNACGHHPYVALSAHQSLQSYAFADARRNVGLYGFDCLDF